jgi:anti-anti-sigma factor
VKKSQSQANSIALEGEWDVTRKNELKALFNSLTTDGPATIDLRAVTYVDSTALSLLAALSLRFKNSPITLIRPNASVLRLLKLLRFNDLFHIVDAE